MSREKVPRRSGGYLRALAFAAQSQTRGDEREIVAHVTHCEWARYYLEHHPSGGYLLACSTNDPMYRLQCDDVRFQRRCTLMEGGDYCEFCFYRL